MRIILAGPRGFCAGVNMAIEALEQAITAYGTPLFVYHEIVHNKWVVDWFRRQGVVFVNDLADVPEGRHLLYSAHGVPPSIRQQAAARRLKTIDVTCPLVTKVHREAVRFAEKGYTILLIGHAGHDEVVATMGEAPDSIRLIQKTTDIDAVEVPDPSRVAYLTQTTLSVADAAEIIERLRQRFPQIVGPARNDICYATQNRQEAVRLLAVEADVVLVVGSGNSSNSQRLAELARACGVATHLIDGPADIDMAWFSSPKKEEKKNAPPPGEARSEPAAQTATVPSFRSGEETVLMTAGASAPEALVQRCVSLLQDRFGASIETRMVCREQLRFALPILERSHP
jgi:4-hydroxy-3-methylbut-2-en-1-yl diphosphate reductase